MIRGRSLVLLGVVLLLALGCGDEPDPSSESPPIENEEGCSPGEEIETDSGLQYQEVTCGEGEPARRGQVVSVHYEGRLTSGTVFDSSYDRDEPFPFALGAGDVIAGWDEGIVGMQVGGVRRLVIPPDLAYGDGGYPPLIPPDATLIFEVELLEISSR